jgi:uncharacterized small protein (DUF1192 family)
MNVIGLFQRRGHTCTFTIEFESLSCLIQQQQPLQQQQQQSPPPPPQQQQQQQQQLQQQSLPPSRKSLLSGFKIANNIGQMIDDAIGGLMGDIDRAPPTGVLRKNVVICWKRGKKKKGELPFVATFNPTTYAYEFNGVQPNNLPSIQVTATMEPIEKPGTSASQSLLERTFKRKELKISLKEYVCETDGVQQYQSQSMKRKKICSFILDLSTCFLQLKQQHQRLGEKCPMTVSMMTLTSKSFAKVLPNSSVEKKMNLTYFSERVRNLGKTNIFKPVNQSPTPQSTEPQLNLTGLLLLKMYIEPKFIAEDEETVNSETEVSVDKSEEYVSDIEEELKLRKNDDRTKNSKKENNEMTRNNSLDSMDTDYQHPTLEDEIKSHPAVHHERTSQISAERIEQLRPKTPRKLSDSHSEVLANIDSPVETYPERGQILRLPYAILDAIKKTRTLNNNDEDKVASVTPRLVEAATIIKDLEEKLQGAEKALAQYKQQVEHMLQREAANAFETKREYEQRIAQLQSENDKLKAHQQELESSSKQLLDEIKMLHSRLGKLNDEITYLKENNARSIQQAQQEHNAKIGHLESECEALRVQLNRKEQQKTQVDQLNKDLQAELAKIRVKLKHQEAKLLLQQEQQQQQQQEISIELQLKHNVPHPFPIAIVWGLISCFCILLALPFIDQVLQNIEKQRNITIGNALNISDYIFRQGIACFGAMSLFSFFGLQLARRLHLHTHGTYLINFLKGTTVIQGNGSNLSVLDESVIDNAKSSVLWGFCLGLIMRFIDWLFLFRFIAPTTATDLTIARPRELLSGISLWKKLFYSIYCAVTGELIGRLLLFLLFVELLRKLMIYARQQKDKQSKYSVLDKILKYCRYALSMEPMGFDSKMKSLISNIESSANELSVKNSSEPSSPATIDSASIQGSEAKSPNSADISTSNSVLNGQLNGLVFAAMILSSLAFAIYKCPWELTMYPPSTIFILPIAVLRCFIIHGVSAMVFCYMFFIQENIEFAMLAHIAMQFVFLF